MEEHSEIIQTEMDQTREYQNNSNSSSYRNTKPKDYKTTVSQPSHPVVNCFIYKLVRMFKPEFQK